LKKLSISHGIAQSVKLSVFESNIDELIEATRPLPQELSIHGRINLSRKEISQLMGRLFIQRSLVNLQSNILDVPDFFWEHDEYGNFFFFNGCFSIFFNFLIFFIFIFFPYRAIL